ncbi:MAG: hypothetical protein ABR929_14280 [Roseiarcus sp.]|jgi:hypothetical protein
MARFPELAQKDDAADASQFLLRVGYVVFALGAPVGVVLHPVAVFVLFPIGVGLMVVSALLDPAAGALTRIGKALRSPLVLVGLAGLVWAGLSILWTPFPVVAGQRVFKLTLLTSAILLVLTTTREHARATDLYLFPLGLTLAMAAILAAWTAAQQGAPLDQNRIPEGARAIAVLLFPTMGALVARGRNGYARLLLILAFVYASLIGATATTTAMFAGFAALSFAVSDPNRTARDLSRLAAALILLTPLIPALVSFFARWMLHAKLGSLPPPYPSLGVANDAFLHDKARLLIGHGFETVARGVHEGILPPQTPRALAFEIWYELGIVGALIAAAGAWLAFRAIGAAPPRLAPYLAAALTCNLTLGFLVCDLSDMTWLVLLAIAGIAIDVAARSQYRTTRPSAVPLAHF